MDLVGAQERMSEPQRTVFREFYVAGHSPEEICRRHGWTRVEFDSVNVGMLRGLREGGAAEVAEPEVSDVA
ncbi:MULTISPECIES: hypothetical protein [unclassified Burkholderia]|uniref:hypothetical protein n=1 Tax=unclassified Burkholderia TaxID=2613784 RepID=UPI002AAF4010|nr:MULTISPECIES: hypothetical protein [unclassified Burkholderia]